jgi:hypothetical protein
LAGRALDPEGVGQRLLGLRREFPHLTLSQVADKIDWNDPTLPVIVDEPSGVRTARERLAELESRAAEGDRFAAALLVGVSLAEEPVD